MTRPKASFLLRFSDRLHRRRQAGQGMVEYALILVLIAIAAIIAVTVVGQQTSNAFSSVSSGLAGTSGTQTASYKTLALRYEASAYWPLSDTNEPTAADQIGVDTGSLQGGVTEYGTQGTKGVPGAPTQPVMNFDGQSGSVIYTANDTTITGPYSIAGWFKTNGKTDDVAQVIIGSDFDSNSRVGDFGRQLYVGNDGHLYFGEWTGLGEGVVTSSTATVTDGSWHYAVGVFDGSELHLYLDGNLVGTLVSAPNPGDPRSTADNSIGVGYWDIGNGQGACNWPKDWSDNSTSGYAPFNGDLADITVFPSALNATQVHDLYTASN
jgi:Flp pilus assembly pilin Flp